jgi:hypothetical protein
MAFRKDVKSAAYRRANGQCECMRQSCMAHYAGRCTRLLADGWHAHRVDPGGPEALDTCEALCIPCYEAEIARRPREAEAAAIPGGAGRVDTPAPRGRSGIGTTGSAPPPAPGDPDH